MNVTILIPTTTWRFGAGMAKAMSAVVRICASAKHVDAGSGIR